jgi:MFS family permease
MMMIAPLSTGFVRRFGNKLVVGFGLVLVALSLSAFGLLSIDAPLWEILVVTLLMGVGMGNVMAPATDSIMGSLPRAKAGVGSAMNDTTRQTGGAIGVAVLGSILASKFHSSMSSASAAAHLPAAVTSAIHTDIGTALTVSRTPTGAPFAQTITSIARQSFVTSFHLASFVGAAVILLAAAAVFVWLPARAADEEPAPVATTATVDEQSDVVWEEMEPAFDG